MKRKKENVYKDPYEKSGAGMLALLFRKIVSENNWDQLWKYFVSRYKAKGGTVSANTVYRYRKDKSLSAKNFFMAILKVLPVEKLTITIELTLINGDKKIHSLSVDGDMVTDEKDKEEVISMLNKIKDDNDDNGVDRKK